MTSTVLVVDNSPAVRGSLEILLEEFGFQVALAGNGREAVAAFRNIDPDIVVTDIFMPEQDGIGAISEMRRLRPDAKIVAMSGAHAACDIDYLAMAMKLGATAAIGKPFEADELISVLRDLVEQDNREIVRAA